MTVTLDEAQASLAQLMSKAAAGEDVFITALGEQTSVKLVPVAAPKSRLPQHPDLKGSLIILDHDALVKPLPPEEWGDLADP